MIAIVLPVYNEGRGVRDEVAAISQVFESAHEEYIIILVDDGSTDDSFLQIDGTGEKGTVSIVRHEQNRGLGAALHSGITKALSMPAVTMIITKDADMTQDVRLLSEMVAVARKTQRDIVIASRYVAGATQEGVPVVRNGLSYIGNRLFRYAFSGRGVTDFTCNYRLYTREVVETGFRRFPGGLITKKGFDSIVELLLKLLTCGATAAEVPLVLMYNNKKGASKMRVVSYCCQCLSLLFPYVYRSRRYG